MAYGLNKTNALPSSTGRVDLSISPRMRAIGDDYNLQDIFLEKTNPIEQIDVCRFSIHRTKMFSPIRTCDACKFKHQKCDSATPCGSCVARRLKCTYSRAPASRVAKPEYSFESPAARQAQARTDTKSPDSSRSFVSQQHDPRSSVESSITGIEALPEQSKQLRPSLDSESSPSGAISQNQQQTTAATIALQESLIGEIEALMTDDLHGKDLLLEQSDDTNLPRRSDFDGDAHRVLTINPFNFYGASEVKSLLTCFLHRVNSVFYSFNEEELRNLLDTVSETTPNIDNRTMCELCLALALGAQASDLEDSDKTMMWYENGRRYLDNENWEDEPWIMRVMTLLGIYHLLERPKTAYRYLRIGMSIGRANLLDQNLQPTPFAQGEDIKWTHVWRTARFLQNWLVVTRFPLSFENAVEGFDASGQALDRLLAPCHDDHLAQILMARLSSNLCRIMQDVYVAPAAALQKFETHMTELQIFTVQLPEQYQISDLDQINASSDEQRAVLIHIHILRLGSVILLTRPLLLRTVNMSREQSSSTPALDFGVREFANVCIDAASNLIHLCNTAFQAEHFPRRSWLLLYFLFEAFMVSVLGAVWHRKREILASDRSISCLQRAKTDLDTALRMLHYSALSSNAAMHYHTVATRFERWIRDI